MNCHRVVNLMSAYIDGELTGAEMLAIRRHMHDCQECAEEYESMRTVKQAVASLRNITPRKDFALEIMSRLDTVEVPAHQRLADSIVRFVNGRLSPVAAALVASGVAIVLLTAGGIDGMAPQMMPIPPVAESRIQGAAFIRPLHEPSFAVAESRPPVMASETREAGPELHFASLSR